MGCILTKNNVSDIEDSYVKEYHDLASFYSHMNSLLSANKGDLEGEEEEDGEEGEETNQAQIELAAIEQVLIIRYTNPFEPQWACRGG
jgi:head-tail adaptor